MIAGIGIDMVEIARIRALLRRHPEPHYIFGSEELAFLRLRGSIASYAANFCAKEAFAKALGTGLRGFRLSEVQLLRDEAGRPFYRFSGQAQRLVLQLGLVVHVSVTHTQTFAAAYAVAERVISY